MLLNPIACYGFLRGRQRPSPPTSRPGRPPPDEQLSRLKKITATNKRLVDPGTMWGDSGRPTTQLTTQDLRETFY
jgi:hypothetical protein